MDIFFTFFSFSNSYALANQAGGADEWKTEIVKCGGLEPLLRFTQTSSDSGLVGLIYYSLSKLSLVDENKAAVGTHVPLLVELLRGDVAEYKGHALKTLVNLVTHPGSRARMIEVHSSFVSVVCVRRLCLSFSLLFVLFFSWIWCGYC